MSLGIWTGQNNKFKLLTVNAMEFSFEVPQDAREMPPSVGPDFVPIDAHVRVHGHFDSTLNCFVFFTGRSQLKKTKSLFKDLLISSWLKNTQFDS